MVKLALQAHPSPQVFQPRNTRTIYGTLVLGLVLLNGWGVVLYGLPGLLTLAGGVLGFLLADAFVARIVTKKGYDVLQSLALGLIFVSLLPPNTGLFLAIFAGAGGTILGRWTFGGMGGMWIHPALVGLLLLSFFTSGALDRFLSPVILEGTWVSPEILDSPPLANQLTRYFVQGPVLSRPAEIIGQSPGAQFSVDQGLRSWLNTQIFHPFGVNLPGGYIASFLGVGGTPLGAGSMALVLLVSIFLVGRQVIHSRVSFWYLFVVIVGIYVYGDVPVNGQWFRGDMLFFLSSGTMLFSGFFLYADFSLAPAFKKGQIFYGIFGGLFTLIFVFGGIGIYSGPFGAVTISLIGVITNRYLRPKLYGKSRRLAL